MGTIAKISITALCLFFVLTLPAQVKIRPDSTTALRLSAIPAANKYYQNVEIATLYKELHHFSGIAPFGELFSGNHYVFTTDINPLYIFSNSIRSRWNIGVGARILARLFKDSSYPIRTPSYIPTIKIYYRISSTMATYKFLDISVTHHSNGQDKPSKINGQWNDKEGNFSTNWITLSYNWGQNEGTWRNHFSAYFIQHFSIGSLLAQDDSLYGYYGQTRVGFDFQKRMVQDMEVYDKATGEKYFGYQKERFRLHAYLNLILLGLYNYPTAALERRVNTEITAHYFLKSLREGGFFLGVGYYGEDPYNIFFHNHYFFARLGISAGHPLFKIK